MKKIIGLNSTTLRVLAMGLMLIDHMGAVLFPEATWIRILGRLAFPIFAFQTAEGYRHTRDFGRYCRRLLVFGLISELPFNLMGYGSPVFPLHQNVMFTLMLGLLACQAFDTRRYWQILLIYLAAVFTFPDYGALGVMSVLLFHVFRESRIVQLLGMIAIHVFSYGGQTIPLLGGAVHFPVQGFAVFALIPIWLYNGEKGPGGKAFQYAAYAFYPAHMFLLWLLTRL